MGPPEKSPDALGRLGYSSTKCSSQRTTEQQETFSRVVAPWPLLTFDRNQLKNCIVGFELVVVAYLLPSESNECFHGLDDYALDHYSIYFWQVGLQLSSEEDVSSHS